MATNFDAGAGVDDGTCTFVSVSGTIASFGYLSGCRVFLDGFGSSYSPEGKRGREDPYDTSSPIGHYTVVYRQQGVINVQPANATGGFPCTDTISGSSLTAPLRTLMNASLVSPLTTIATALVGASLSNSTGQPTLHASPDQGQRNFSDALGNFSVAAAANMVCRNLIPPVPCADSFQPCDSATGFADACTLNGSPLSVFHFDALNEYIYSDLPEAAWSAWIVGQLNAYFTVGCATNALICASREAQIGTAAGSGWTTSCAAQGVVVGNHSKEALGTAIFFSLAEMIALGPANLEDQTGAGVADLISRASARLGVAPINALSLSQQCGMQNFVTYTSLTGAGSGRRALAAEQASLSSSTDAPSRAATEAMPVAVDEDVEELAGEVAKRVGRVCDALQPHRSHFPTGATSPQEPLPHRSHCRQRLERVLVRLNAQEEKRRRVLTTALDVRSSRRSSTVGGLAPLEAGPAPLEVGPAPLEAGPAPLKGGPAPEPTHTIPGWWLHDSGGGYTTHTIPGWWLHDSGGGYTTHTIPGWWLHDSGGGYTTHTILGWWSAPPLLLTALVTTILLALKKGGQRAGRKLDQKSRSQSQSRSGRKLDQRDQHGARLPAGMTSAHGSLAGSPPLVIPPSSPHSIDLGSATSPSTQPSPGSVEGGSAPTSSEPSPNSIELGSSARVSSGSSFFSRTPLMSRSRSLPMALARRRSEGEGTEVAAPRVAATSNASPVASRMASHMGGSSARSPRLAPSCGEEPPPVPTSALLMHSVPTSALLMRSGRKRSTSFEQPEAASEAAPSPRGAAARARSDEKGRASSDETGRASSDETGKASSDETGNPSSWLPHPAMPRTLVLQLPLLETSMDATQRLEGQRRRSGSSKSVGAAAATSPPPASSILGSSPTCSPRRSPRRSPRPPPTPLSRVNLEQISARSPLSRDRLLMQEGPPLRPPSSTDESSDSNRSLSPISSASECSSAPPIPRGANSFDDVLR